MKRSSRQSGFSFSEVLITMLISMFILTLVYQQLVAIFVGEMAAADTGQTAADNRMAVDTMADHVRNAVLNTSGSGVTNSALSAATATSFTYYTSATSGATVTYALSGSNLVRTPSGGTAVTEQKNITALQFTYYKASTYNSAWSTTTNPQAPTTAELPNVCGIFIDVTTVEDKVTFHMTTTVRLRNSPLKTNMNGL